MNPHSPYLFDLPEPGPWQAAVLQRLKSAVRHDGFWDEYFHEKENPLGFSLHLAVLHEPYLGLILQGHKTVEARFSSGQQAPFECVAPGDMLLLKRAGAKIEGIALVRQCWCYRLHDGGIDEIRAKFAAELGIADPSFWTRHRSARFATLIQIEHSRAIRPIPCFKRDRRGWVVLWAAHRD